MEKYNIALHEIADIILGIRRGVVSAGKHTLHVAPQFPTDMNIELYEIDQDTGERFLIQAEFVNEYNVHSYLLYEGKYQIVASLDLYETKLINVLVTKSHYGEERTIEVTLEDNINNMVLVHGIVKEYYSGELLADKDVYIKTPEGRVLKTVETNENGEFIVYLRKNDKYSVQVLLGDNDIVDLPNYWFSTDENQDYQLETITIARNLSGSYAYGNFINIMNGGYVTNADFYLFKGWNYQLNPNFEKDVEVSEIHGKSNQNGYYHIETEPGNYTIVVRKNNYYESYGNIIVEQGISHIQNVMVVPLSTAEVDGMQIVLTWNDKIRDVDSHICGYINNSRIFHVYYSDKNYYEDGTLYVNLDVDDTSYYGPETTTIFYASTSMKYVFYAYNWSKENTLDKCAGNVKVYYQGDLLYSIDMPTEPTDYNYWRVLEYDADSKRVYIINQFEYSEPTIRVEE